MEGMQQQQEVIAELDTKVDTTIDTVITIGDTVVKHDKDIGKLEEGLDRVDERVDDVEEDLGETKLKVEEVDNKVGELSRDMKFPTMWCFDKCRLRRACSASFKLRNSKGCSGSNLTAIEYSND